MYLSSLLTAVSLSAEGEGSAAEQGFLPKIWNSLTNWFIDERGWVHVLLAVAAILIGLLVIKIIMSISRKLINKSRLKGIAGNFLLAILKTILVFVYLMIIMRIVGIDTSSMVALLAAGSLALSLALQSTLSNFASGMILVSNHPFKEGDFIDAAGVSGTVEKITLFSTKLKTPDNKVVTLPNSSVAGGNIINYSTEE
ncbi:MAG: mechanosensitive ion channel, partial [Clostridia bacterium]|nr:mechanosensitive ion channel [Clostridia bacterium]